MLLYRTFALLALTLLLGHEALAQKKPPPVERIPSAIMSAELPAINGGTIRLADYDGQVTVLIMWQPWCNPCNIAAGELNEFEQEFSARGVRVVGLISRDDETTAETASRVTDTYKIAYRSVWISSAQSRALGGRGVLPQILVIKDDGVILTRLEGRLIDNTETKMREAVEKALGVKTGK